MKKKNNENRLFVTYADCNAIFIGPAGKFHNELGTSSFFGVVQRSKSTDDFNTVLSGYFSLGRHFSDAEKLS